MSMKMFNRNKLPHELTIRQKIKLRNAFENNISIRIKLSKTQISKIILSGGFLGWLLSKTAGSLIKVAVPIAKYVLASLGIIAIDARIQKKIHGSGITTLIISNEEMNDIMKIVKALEDSNILLKGITKSIENETKEQEGGFLGMLLGTLGVTIIFIIFWDFLMFYQNSLSPQVKGHVIITYKHGIYELPYELSNELRLSILRN